MAVDWAEIKKALYPIPDYNDLSRRWREAFVYAFVRQHYNPTLAEMADYTRHLLGEDTKQRYHQWMEDLLRTMSQLEAAGVRGICDLVGQVDDEEKFEGFIAQTGLDARAVVGVLTYLVYWFIPAKKGLGELIKDDPVLKGDIARLRACGIRCNLDLLEQGITPAARQDLVARSGVPVASVTGLVHRADFSRLPWASRATISNLIGAGFSSLAQLAQADLEQARTAFYRYGESIHKNLKFGNEIDNSHRIARIVPKVVEDG